MNYNKILLKLLSKWLCRAIAWDAIVAGGNKEKNYLGTITWKPFIWGPLSGGNFPGDIYLGVIISSQLFCEAIVWTPIVQALIIIIIIIIIIFFFFGGGVIGEAILGRQLSRGQLSWAAM